MHHPADPDLGVKAIQCLDVETELYQPLDLVRIAGTAKQVQ